VQLVELLRQAVDTEFIRSHLRTRLQSLVVVKLTTSWLLVVVLEGQIEVGVVEQVVCSLD
jgi:hypothetical protein